MKFGIPECQVLRSRRRILPAWMVGWIGGLVRAALLKEVGFIQPRPLGTYVSSEVVRWLPGQSSVLPFRGETVER